MCEPNTPLNSTTRETLTQYDVILLNHDDLNEFITRIPKPETLTQTDTAIFTEDNNTRGTVEFNAITITKTGTGTEATIATQLHHPIKSTDTVLDCRSNTTTTFADYITGLQ